MIACISSAAFAFVGGFFACAVIGDGPNGYVGPHLWIALAFVVGAGLIAGSK